MKRLLPKYAIDLTVWTLVTPIAFWVRVETEWLSYNEAIAALVTIGIPVKAVVIVAFALYKRSWRRLNLRDLLALGSAVITVTLVSEMLVSSWAPLSGIPQSIPIIDGLLGLVSLGSVRLVTRIFYEEKGRLSKTKAKRSLIIGAGEAGTMIARAMQRHPSAKRIPIGFLDDDPAKLRQRLEGLRVLGPIDSLANVLEKRRIDEVIIAMPSQSGEVIRRIVTAVTEAGIEHRTIPGIAELLSGRVSISQIREVDVDDLLRRDPIRLDMAEIASYLKREVVLVTGAGGSIGSEIVRQVARFEPAAVVLMGRGEGSIFHIDLEVRRCHPDVNFHTVIGDVCNASTVEHVFATYRPKVVFHTAAYKHVPLMETHPWEAVRNNVGGTRNLVEHALKWGVKRFVNVSTDKAVNPTSIMGATKRVSEMVVFAASRRSAADAAFVSVRFGNVLGSRGSVIPIFKKQIQRGGPVTVTHPEMVRYFMTIPEASQLVLQAGSLAENGNVYVLDMGKPVKIVDLAKDLIMLSGFEVDDIKIVYSGIRPGEKLYEELLTAEEGTNASNHEKIFVARKNGLHKDVLEAGLSSLFRAAEAYDGDEIRRVLATLVPTNQLTAKVETDGLNEDQLLLTSAVAS